MAARNRGLWVGCTAVLYEYNLRFILNCCCWYSSTRYHDSLSKHINKCLCIYRPHPISNIRPALNGLQKWPKSPKSKLKIGTAKIILFDFLFYIFINRRLKSSRIIFFLFPNPQNSAIFSFFFCGRFFCSPFKPGLRRSEAKQDIHSLYICLWDDDIWETAVLLEITWYMWVFFVWHSAELIRNSIFLSKDGVYVVATFFLPLCAMYVRQ